MKNKRNVILSSNGLYIEMGEHTLTPDEAMELGHLLINTAKQAAELGKRASEICRDQNFSIGSAAHPLFGKVNTYPKEILDRIINPGGHA